MAQERRALEESHHRLKAELRAASRSAAASWRRPEPGPREGEERVRTRLEELEAAYEGKTREVERRYRELDETLTRQWAERERALQRKIKPLWDEARERYREDISRESETWKPFSPARNRISARP